MQDPTNRTSKGNKAVKIENRIEIIVASTAPELGLSFFLECSQAFQEVLALVRGARMKIAIDDAGSGYSGLESILHLKPDYIKVADTLVRNIHADPIKREIIASLESIGRRIGATLVAEGIEVEAERKTLVDLGVAFGQGFLLGRPSFQVNGRVSRN